MTFKIMKLLKKCTFIIFLDMQQTYIVTFILGQAQLTLKVESQNFLDLVLV